MGKKEQPGNPASSLVMDGQTRRFCWVFVVLVATSMVDLESRHSSASRPISSFSSARMGRFHISIFTSTPPPLPSRTSHLSAHLPNPAHQSIKKKKLTRAITHKTPHTSSTPHSSPPFPPPSPQSSKPSSSHPHSSLTRSSASAFHQKQKMLRQTS